MKTMNNPLIGGQQMNPMQMLQQLRSNPMQFIKRAGFRVPDNMTDPNAIIQHLMQTGQISQEKYNRAFQMAQQFRR
jgi:hypothetical protein